MSERKWTPGPWKCDKSPVFGSWFVRQDPSNWKGDGYQFICETPADKKGTHHGDMFRANAQLIAAAPNLYEALELLVKDVADYPAWQRPCHALDIARAALNLALPQEAEDE